MANIESFSNTNNTKIRQNPPTPCEKKILDVAYITKIVIKVLLVTSLITIILIPILVKIEVITLAATTITLLILGLVAFSVLNSLIYLVCKSYDRYAEFVFNPASAFENLMKKNNGIWTSQKEALLKKYGYCCENLITNKIKFGIPLSKTITKPFRPYIKNVTSWEKEIEEFLSVPSLKDHLIDVNDLGVWTGVLEIYNNAILEKRKDNLPLGISSANQLKAEKLIVKFLNEKASKHLWSITRFRAILSYCPNLKNIYTDNLFLAAGLALETSLKNIEVKPSFEEFRKETDEDLENYRHLF